MCDTSVDHRQFFDVNFSELLKWGSHVNQYGFQISAMINSTVSIPLNMVFSQSNNMNYYLSSQNITVKHNGIWHIGRPVVFHTQTGFCCASSTSSVSSKIFFFRVNFIFQAV